MPEAKVFYSSLVVEHIVAKTNSKRFKQWHQKLNKVAKHRPGFVRLDLCSPLPCADDVDKWYSIVHFDSPQHLNDWVGCEERDRILKSGQDIFRAYRFKSFTTGLEGWFSQQASSGEQTSLGPPAWKQILSVVFGLYPIVMVRLKLFPQTGLVGEWSPSGEMLLTTLITSSILAIGVMPLVTRLMGFWLYPAYRDMSAYPSARWKVELSGLALMGLGLMFMVAIFDRV